MSDGVNMRQGRSIALNIAAPTQVSQVSKDQTLANARLVRVNVVAVGTAPGSVNDTGNGTATAANLLTAIPNVLGPFLVDAPVQAGIFVTPGAAQVVTVTYD
jgi:Mg2+/citrate symporter